MYFYQLLKLPVGFLIFCESGLCPSRVEDLRRHPGGRFPNLAAVDGCLPFVLSLWPLWWGLILCLLPVFSPGFSIRVRCFPDLCHVPISIFAWIFIIFLLVALQSQLTAVISGFDICLTSSLPLSGSLKYSPLKHLSTSLCFGWCPAAKHALSRTSILSTYTME